jgi:hypothetical protein
LQTIQRIAEDDGYQMERLIDRRTKQAFLLIQNKNGVLVAICNLLPRTKDIVYLDKNTSLKLKTNEFIDQRKAWLLARVN